MAPNTIPSLYDMETIPKDTWHHRHDFAVDSSSAERKVNIVFALTTVTMFIEIITGSLFGSMALLADGWHMFTHSAAFAIALFAYWYANKHKENPVFTFGTGKVTSLGGFASAVALAVVALMMAMESIERLFSPQGIRFEEAITVAFLGLGVNLLSAFLLHDDHHHHGNPSHHHHDHNLKAAYFHVLADTLTSVFAIIALIAGKYLGWIWMDALMGIIGSLVIAKWAYNLLKQSSVVLLDKNENTHLSTAIKELIQTNSNDMVADLHIWQLSPKHTSVILSVVTSTSYDSSHFKALITSELLVSHITVEVNKV